MPLPAYGPPPLPERFANRQAQNVLRLARLEASQAVVPTRLDINAVATPPKASQLSVAAENAPLRLVYGRQRLGAQLANLMIYENQLVVHAIWCQGEISSFELFTMNDAALPASVTATHYTGAPGQTADATLIAAFAAMGITYADTLDGIAYSVFQVPVDVSSGLPQFAAEIKGFEVYDPRTLTTAWSDNPALCLADFIASASYGLNRTTDSASVEDAADECDEVVGANARRRLNLVIDKVATTRQHLEALRAYAGCFIVETGGNLKLVPDRPRATDHTVTGSDIMFGSLKLSRLGVQDVPTVVDVRWTDTSVTPWIERSAIAYADGVIAGTTPRRESQISLPGIHLYSQAYREAVERLNHFALEDLEAEWTGFDEASAILPGHIVSLTHPVGLTAKLMRVVDATAVSAGRWRIKAREYDPAAYSDDVVSEPTYSDTSLPSPANPDAVTGLVLTEEVYQMANGTWTTRIKAEWDAADYPYIRHYRVEVYQLGELIYSGTPETPIYRTPPVQELVAYVVKVSVVSTIGAVGTVAQADIDILGKYLVPSDVPELTVFEAGGSVYMAWNPAVDVDIWRYEIRYGIVSGDWESATLLDRVDALRLTTNTIATGTWVAYVKALDSVGLYSNAAASATFTVTSDAAAFLVDTYNSDTPTLTNMAEYDLFDGVRNWVTEDGVAFATKCSANLDTYTDPLATYHSSLTSEWLGESADFGLLVGGQWTGTASVSALNGSIASSMGFSDDGTTWAYQSGLSHRISSRFARLKHQALTTSTLKASVPTQSIRLDAVPREEVGASTSSASGPITITLDNVYVAVKRIIITPEGTTARSSTYDNIVMSSPTTFDVYIFNDAGVKIASPFRWAFQGV
ncbi:phage tail protein [Candidatus Nitrotoga sp. M5]|uniref:phage tail protein n=1 Tax=Candidatus Nitrotoga sp. M5 TaxID=2890409 RepID=UPI001EF585A3|nr:phage tail protein [Candidatus Nitrotoga sp. M5]CAH1387014.1 hypothetical protein NTGM5_480010 [Candidatus Nitrotoga sp. M5]